MIASAYQRDESLATISELIGEVWILDDQLISENAASIELTMSLHGASVTRQSKPWRMD